MLNNKTSAVPEEHNLAWEENSSVLPKILSFVLLLGCIWSRCRSCLNKHKDMSYQAWPLQVSVTNDPFSCGHESCIKGRSSVTLLVHCRATVWHCWGFSEPLWDTIKAVLRCSLNFLTTESLQLGGVSRETWGAREIRNSEHPTLLYLMDRQLQIALCCGQLFD